MTSIQATASALVSGKDVAWVGELLGTGKHGLGSDDTDKDVFY
jgi:hypothetical protein